MSVERSDWLFVPIGVGMLYHVHIENLDSSGVVVLVDDTLILMIYPSCAEISTHGTPCLPVSMIRSCLVLWVERTRLRAGHPGIQQCLEASWD